MKQVFRWANLIFYLAMVTVNALANILPLNGVTTGDVSIKYTNLFTPAPYTFSIWGVIYLFMGFFAIYTAIKAPEHGSVAAMRHSIGILFLLSCVFNIAWIYTWHYEKIGASVLCILGLLLTLILINMRFTIKPKTSFPVRVSIYGFNLYLGWITAAVIANISVYLTKVNWSRFGLSETVWTIVILAVACLLGVLFVLVGGRFMATISLAWALIGILVKHLSKAGFHNTYPAISITLVFVSVILWLCILYHPLRTYLLTPSKKKAETEEP